MLKIYSNLRFAPRSFDQSFELRGTTIVENSNFKKKMAIKKKKKKKKKKK